MKTAKAPTELQAIVNCLHHTPHGGLGNGKTDYETESCLTRPSKEHYCSGSRSWPGYVSSSSLPPGVMFDILRSMTPKNVLIACIRCFIQYRDMTHGRWLRYYAHASALLHIVTRDGASARNAFRKICWHIPNVAICHSDIHERENHSGQAIVGGRNTQSMIIYMARITV